MVNPDQTKFGTPPTMEPWLCFTSFRLGNFSISVPHFFLADQLTIVTGLVNPRFTRVQVGSLALKHLKLPPHSSNGKTCGGFTVPPAFTLRWLPPQLLLK